MVIAADYPFLGHLLDDFHLLLVGHLVLDPDQGACRTSSAGDDLSGWGKAGWTVFVIVLPFLGAFIYLIAHGGDMGKRDVEQAQASQAQLDDHVRSVSAPAGAATEIEKAKQLLDSGAITQPEFDAIKAKAVG